jgi:hypothetical protein
MSIYQRTMNHINENIFIILIEKRTFTIQSITQKNAPHQRTSPKTILRIR